jgi:hypothetical protein
VTTPPHDQPPDRLPTTISKQDAVKTLRHAGVSAETIRKFEAEFPEVIDYDRDAAALGRLGISRGELEERFGSSP